MVSVRKSRSLKRASRRPPKKSIIKGGTEDKKRSRSRSATRSPRARSREEEFEIKTAIYEQNRPQYLKNYRETQKIFDEVNKSVKEKMNKIINHIKKIESTKETYPYILFVNNNDLDIMDNMIKDLRTYYRLNYQKAKNDFLEADKIFNQRDSDLETYGHMLNKKKVKNELIE